MHEVISGLAANSQGGSLTSPTAAECAGQQSHFGQTNAEDNYICAANRDNGPDATVAVTQSLWCRNGLVGLTEATGDTYLFYRAGQRVARWMTAAETVGREWHRIEEMTPAA